MPLFHRHDQVSRTPNRLGTGVRAETAQVSTSFCPNFCNQKTHLTVPKKHQRNITSPILFLNFRWKGRNFIICWCLSVSQVDPNHLWGIRGRPSSLWRGWRTKCWSILKTLAGRCLGKPLKWGSFVSRLCKRIGGWKLASFSKTTAAFGRVKRIGLYVVCSEIFWCCCCGCGFGCG